MNAHFAKSRLLIEHVACIDSSNSELLRRDFLIAPDSGAEAVWLVAEHQTGGRGRRQRSWLSTPGASLTGSFAREVCSPTHLGALSLVAGVAIAETLAGFGADVRLKWPNDIHVGAGKAGGILCEARARGGLTRIVIGCGLNLFQPQTTHPAAQATPLPDQPIAGLFDVLAQRDRERLCAAIGLSLLEATDLLLAEGFEAFRERWRSLDLLQHHSIIIHDKGGTKTAVARGIDRDGALLVETDAQPGYVQRLLAEEVSVRTVDWQAQGGVGHRGSDEAGSDEGGSDCVLRT